MSENKTTLSLSDLGLEMDQTPADIVAESHKDDAIKMPEINKVESVKSSHSVHVEEEKSNKPFVPTPQNTEGEQFQQVNIAQIAPFKEKKDPIRKTLDNFYDLADKGIERTKKEISAPGGLIDTAKRKYVDEKYANLVQRAKSNPSLKTHMQKVDSFMKTDPRFDGISEYERRAYIVFAVAKDDNTGVDDNYIQYRHDHRDFVPLEDRSYHFTEVDDKWLFNNEDEELSHEDNKEESKPVETVSYEDEDVLPMESSNTDKEDDDDDEVTYEDEENTDDDNDITTVDDEDTEESPVEDDEDDVSDEELKEMSTKFRSDIRKAFGYDQEEDLDDFDIGKPVRFTNKLLTTNTPKTATWVLQYSGKPVEMTPLTGEELLILSPDTTDYTTIAGINKVFNTIYHHVVNRNKPAYDVWIKQISDYDVDNLLFAIYNANFKDSNYINYECPNHKCRNIFLAKKDVMEMVEFPNDKVKARFDSIIKKEPVDTQMVRTKPKRVNNKYAIGYTTQSIFSNIIEPMSLSEADLKRYQSVVSLMPNIDKVYIIDNEHRSLTPISFGVVNGSVEKTTLRKVKGLATIMKTLTIDERSKVVSEVTKMAARQRPDQIKYVIPAHVCPKCGTPIPERRTTPDGRDLTVLNLLFIRAQLALAAAFTEE